MDKKQYYDSEEKLGRQRKYRKVFENHSNVIDFELYVLPSAFKQGGAKLVKKVYSHFLKKGYDFYGN